MDINLLDIFVLICIYTLSFLFAIVGRELFVGLVAMKYGDFTPMQKGRITLNPFKHLDIFGSLIIPIILIANGAFFGYAKPMDIKYTTIQQKSNIKCCLCVALAGTFFNLFSALFIFLLLKIGVKYKLIDGIGVISQILFIMFSMNVIIAIVNLLPIAPFDGGKILGFLGLLGGTTIFARMYNKLEKYGIIIVVLMLIIPPTRNIVMGVASEAVALFLRI